MTKYADNVWQTTTTTGTGDLTLDGAVDGYRTFLQAINDGDLTSGDTVGYVVRDSTAFEYGEATITNTGGIVTLDRQSGTVTRSSDSGNRIDVAGAGATQVYIALPSALTLSDQNRASEGGVLAETNNTNTFSVDQTFDADVELYKSGATPSDDDAGRVLGFWGLNDADEKTLYASFEMVMRDVSDGSEDGSLKINLNRNGSSQTVIELFENGIVAEGATGGAQGVGTANFKQLFVDGEELTPGGDVISFLIEAGENVATGDPLVIAADGKAYKPWYSNADKIDGNAFDDVHAIAFVPSEGAVVFIGTDTSGNALRVAAKTFASFTSNASSGALISISGLMEVPIGGACYAVDDANSQFAVVYKDPSDNLVMELFSVSGNTLTREDTETLVASVDEACSIDNDGTTYLVGYRKSGDHLVVAATVSGTTITTGGTLSLSTNSQSGFPLVGFANGWPADQFVAVYQNVSDERAGIIDVSTPATPSLVSSSSLANFSDPKTVLRVDSEGVCIFKSSSEATAIELTSGPTLNLGSSQSIIVSDKDCFYFDEDEGLLITFSYQNNPGLISWQTHSLSGTTIGSASGATKPGNNAPKAFSEGFKFAEVSAVAYHTGINAAIVASSGASETDGGDELYQIFDIKNQSYGFERAAQRIGFAAGTVSAGANVSVVAPGSVATGLSGLTPGRTYFIARDGTLTTSETPYPAGRAITATSLLIQFGDVPTSEI